MRGSRKTAGAFPLTGFVLAVLLTALSLLLASPASAAPSAAAGGRVPKPAPAPYKPAAPAVQETAETCADGGVRDAERVHLRRGTPLPERRARLCPPDRAHGDADPEPTLRSRAAARPQPIPICLLHCVFRC
ncbi:hypothetical protein [Streptomyces sp. NPDC003077]|uniref:hypothetical protein n=1 Tax=Streptomyces sp. NPDC003077 TaxID=3154443 RepID=UPI0033A5B01A